MLLVLRMLGENLNTAWSHTALVLGAFSWLIQILYEVESNFRNANPEQRLEARQRLSVPLLKELRELMDAQALVCLPKSELAQAIKYSLNQWDALNVFVTDGDLTIDNNLAENALRPIALGRKNWMFLGHESGGETIAVIFTLIASCRRHHVVLYAYLRTVIRQLTENPSIDPALLMPDVVALDLTRSPSPDAYSHGPCTFKE